MNDELPDAGGLHMLVKSTQCMQDAGYFAVQLMQPVCESCQMQRRLNALIGT